MRESVQIGTHSKKRRLGTLRVLNSTHREANNDGLLVNKATQVFEDRKMELREKRCLECWKHFTDYQSIDDDTDDEKDNEINSYDEEVDSQDKISELEYEKQKLQQNNTRLAKMAYVRFRRFKVQVPKNSSDAQTEVSDQSVQVEPADLEKKRTLESFVNYCDL